jgi:anti-sigma B factor antagonist
VSAPYGGDPLIVQERDEAGVRVIAVAGELDIATAPDLCARLDAGRSGRRPLVMVDLTGVDFCDSTGLRALLGAASEVRAHGGRFAIVCTPSGGVARLLDVVGAAEWMVIHADAQSGLAALTVSSPPRAV